ncbi:MAG: hypothetical protein K2J60_03590 [Acetatifactor sp.]|nr:hypothetical protein [Acetatifactor sp.]
MKVDIYLTTTFKGSFASGTGAYGILLRTMRGQRPAMREHYAGWSGISIQKLNVRAAVEALCYMNAPCDVVIHTDNQYIKYVIENGNTNGKFVELWKSFFAARNRMKSVRVELESGHEYQEYLKGKLAEGKYTVIND